MRNKINIDNRGFIEILFVGFFWLILFLIPVILELLNMSDSIPFRWQDILKWWAKLMPFLLLFIVHHFCVLPVYIKRSKVGWYVVILIFLFLFFLVYKSAFENDVIRLLFGDNRPYPPKSRPRDIVPLPILMDCLLAIMMLGVDILVAMVLKHHREQENIKAIENARLQDELRYLRSQINPHFFMNMLNNIHSMVEISPYVAQSMILELSKLMRYVLYEGRNSMTTLENEVKFICNYVELMRQRYPSDKVSIKIDFPESPSKTVMLPPLLFIAFVENAFKHGVSYRKHSDISIFISEGAGVVALKCRNTKHLNNGQNSSSGGVGLKNVRRRLDILYGKSYKLDITDNNEEYMVDLEIPSL